jgi:hypothetical protein
MLVVEPQTSLFAAAKPLSSTRRPPSSALGPFSPEPQSNHGIMQLALHNSENFWNCEKQGQLAFGAGPKAWLSYCSDFPVLDFF